TEAAADVVAQHAPLAVETISLVGQMEVGVFQRQYPRSIQETQQGDQGIDQGEKHQAEAHDRQQQRAAEEITQLAQFLAQVPQHAAQQRLVGLRGLDAQVARDPFRQQAVEGRADQVREQRERIKKE